MTAELEESLWLFEPKTEIEKTAKALFFLPKGSERKETLQGLPLGTLKAIEKLFRESREATLKNVPFSGHASHMKKAHWLEAVQKEIASRRCGGKKTVQERGS